MLTLEERERIAYIEGRTEEAKLLAAAADLEELDLEERLEAEYSRGYDEGRYDSENK